MLPLQTIKHSHSIYNVNPIDLFNECNAVDADTMKLLQFALDNGAYIAGGFARQTLVNLQYVEKSLVLPYDRKNHVRKMTRRYLGTDQKPPETVTPWAMGNKGDIDLFFERQADMERFREGLFKQRRVRALSATPEPIIIVTSMPDIFTELSVNRNARVQWVEKWIGPIAEILNGFDIFNAAVAFNGEHFIYPEGWEQLEELKMLHVFNWTSTSIVNRITKWFWKHHFSKLSPATADTLGTIAMDLISLFKEKESKGENVKTISGQKLSTYQIVQRMRKFLPELSNEQLVMLTTIYPIGPDTYGAPVTPFTILRDRSEEARKRALSYVSPDLMMVGK